MHPGAERMPTGSAEEAGVERSKEDTGDAPNAEDVLPSQLRTGSASHQHS